MLRVQARPRSPYVAAERAMDTGLSYVSHAVGVLHAGIRWAYLHDCAPARIGQHLTDMIDASISALH